MKFIHIADVHFDMPMISLKGNREYIKKRRIEQKKAFRDVIQLAKKENINENLKQNNQLEWVKCMNNIKNRAEEIVLNELIYC